MAYFLSLKNKKRQNVVLLRRNGPKKNVVSYMLTSMECAYIYTDLSYKVFPEFRLKTNNQYNYFCFYQTACLEEILNMSL